MNTTVQIPTALYAYSPDGGKQFQFTLDPEKPINNQLEQQRLAQGIAADSPVYFSMNPFPPVTADASASPQEVTLTEVKSGTNGLSPVPVPTQFNEELPEKSSSWLGMPITPISPELIYIYYPDGSPSFMTMQWTDYALEGFGEQPYPEPLINYTQYWKLLTEHQITSDTGSSFSQEITYGISGQVSETWSNQLGLSGSIKGVVGISETLTKTLNVGVIISEQTTTTNEFHPGDLTDGNTCGIFAVWQLVNEFVLMDDQLNPITTEMKEFGVVFEAQLLTNTLVCPTNIYQTQFTQFKTKD